jgi:hypothetical protein
VTFPGSCSENSRQRPRHIFVSHSGSSQEASWKFVQKLWRNLVIGKLPEHFPGCMTSIRIAGATLRGRSLAPENESFVDH